MTVAFTGCFGSDDSDDNNSAQPPVAFAGYDKTVTVGSTVHFDGTGSYDPNGDALSYSWSFGDGATGTGATPAHVYSTIGTYTVILTVTANGDSASDTMIVTVIDGSQPVPTGDKWAVVIGIVNYPSQINDLYYPVEDAMDWNDYLTGRGYTVKLQLDNQASKNKNMANGVFTYYFLEKGLGQLGYSALEDAFSYSYGKCASSPWYFHPEKYDGDTSQPFVL